jgi:hypothetical protein
MIRRQLVPKSLNNYLNVDFFYFLIDVQAKGIDHQHIPMEENLIGIHFLDKLINIIVPNSTSSRIHMIMIFFQFLFQISFYYFLLITKNSHFFFLFACLKIRKKKHFLLIIYACTILGSDCECL